MASRSPHSLGISDSALLGRLLNIFITMWAVALCMPIHPATTRPQSELRQPEIVLQTPGKPHARSFTPWSEAGIFLFPGEHWQKCAWLRCPPAWLLARQSDSASAGRPPCRRLHAAAVRLVQMCVRNPHIPVATSKWPVVILCCHRLCHESFWYFGDECSLG